MTELRDMLGALRVADLAPDAPGSVGSGSVGVGVGGV